MLYELPLIGRWLGHLERRLVQTALAQLSNANRDNLLSQLPYQARPRFRLPRPRQSHPRPIVGVAIHGKPRQFERWHWRLACDCCGSERRASPCSLQLSCPGPRFKPSVPPTNLHAAKRQHATRSPSFRRRLAYPMNARPKLRSLRRLKKRRRSCLPASPRFCSFPHSTLFRRSPCLAREKLIRH
jgi:hypothetical protein